MKKPVRAIDMRRTATVLDFAACVVNISSTPAILRERTFLRHCVMLNGCPGYKVRPPVLVGWVNVWLRSEAEVCGALPFWDTLLQTFLLKTLDSVNTSLRNEHILGQISSRCYNSRHSCLIRGSVLSIRRLVATLVDPNLTASMSSTTDTSLLKSSMNKADGDNVPNQKSARDS